MDLKVGETQDVVMWAFPKTLETIQDTLVGRIASNPTPIEFPISCVGAKPKVEVRLDLPSQTASDQADAVPAAPSPVPDAPKPADAKAAAAGKPGAKKAKDPPPPELPLTPRSKVRLLHPCHTNLPSSFNITQSMFQSSAELCHNGNTQQPNALCHLFLQQYGLLPDADLTGC